MLMNVPQVARYIPVAHVVKKAHILPDLLLMVLELPAGFKINNRHFVTIIYHSVRAALPYLPLFGIII